MIFVGFSPLYSFDENLILYEKLKDSMIPWSLFQLIDKNSILTRNGTRKRTYLQKGGKKYIRIQRMVLNHRNYFDLFPTFLIPNSTLLIYDMGIYEKEEYIIEKKKKNSSFEKWLMEQDLDKDIFSKLIEIGSKDNAIFYKTKDKYYSYKEWISTKKEKKKVFFYLIYYEK